jgi:hypothetical protein
MFKQWSKKNNHQLYKECLPTKHEGFFEQWTTFRVLYSCMQHLTGPASRSL